MSYMQCNSSSCITLLAVVVHVIHALIIANTWSSGVTCLNVLSGRWDEVFWGEISHLDCRSPDRLVRKEHRNSSCATGGVLFVFTQLIIVTLVVWQHWFSATLLQHTVTSNHVPVLERSPALFLFLSLPISRRQKEIFHQKKNKNKTTVFNLSLRTNAETKTDVFQQMILKGQFTPKSQVCYL